MKTKIIVALIATSLMLVMSATVIAKGGYDEYGYNYKANIFNGFYGNYNRPAVPVTEDDTWLKMKWNDAWLNEDKVRHEGFPTYIDSGAWLTNHMWGEYDVSEKYDIGGTLYSGELSGLCGWTDPWTWGGNYGGGDDGTFRLLMGPGDGCACEDADAYFEIDTNGAYMDELTLHHLDGSQDDSFELYIFDGYDMYMNEIWTLVGSYTGGQTVGETWETTTFAFDPICGVFTYKLLATEPATAWCENWGQVAFSWVEWSGTAYWNYFVKIVAVQTGDVLDCGNWYRDGVLLGYEIWGQFAVIQEVENDPYAGISGLQYNPPAPTGFGVY